MPISVAPENIPTAFATCSIGHAEDTLREKINVIAQSKFRGIELAFPDLMNFASLRAGKKVAANDYDELCKAAAEVKTLCREVGLEIVMLQPFSNFEGWRQDSKERADAFARADGWIRIMDACDTKMLQVRKSQTGFNSISLLDIVPMSGRIDGFASTRDIHFTRGYSR